MGVNRDLVNRANDRSILLLTVHHLPLCGHPFFNHQPITQSDLTSYIFLVFPASLPTCSQYRTPPGPNKDSKYTNHFQATLSYCLQLKKLQETQFPPYTVPHTISCCRNGQPRATLRPIYPGSGSFRAHHSACWPGQQNRCSASSTFQDHSLSQADGDES